MTQSVLLQTALCLPAADVEALIQGRIIVAMPQNFINPGQQFALYPANVSILPLERYYRSGFLPIAQKVFVNLGSQTVVIKAWAKCESCKMHLPETFESLSQLTVWTKEALKQALGERSHIFLAYLRVYQLLNHCEIPVQLQSRQFVPLPNSLRGSEAQPVVSDRLFTQRKNQLEIRQPSQNPELEELQGALAFLAITNSAAKQLHQDIQLFLGWTTEQLPTLPQQNLAWINDIVALGKRSKEQDEGKSNYQAGTDFENIVRQSIEFLGFTVDEFHKGGAGGVDVFCSQPYPLVGECKAGKKIPNDTAVQLLNLGTLRLKSQEIFQRSTKLIIGPGEPTIQLQDSAKVHGMTIINPETLQKLVKLQSTYRNSIDLFKLKEYLKVGQSDEEVEKYINQVYREMSLRSQIIQAVKELSEQDNENPGAINQGFTVTEIRAHYNATHNPKQTSEAVHDLLIELSSPLTGYLGRGNVGDLKSDRFYFLRNLPINQT
ncbi:DUF1802 family protein [Iningainema tapete]|uniref:DUF1802 family protein n=1 Tax=Iningainema tapete BLCC-T55 TaxID=2748662 RepID=A0A8J6XP82_9CYAN|nr:DUF1802 family protein [Iningainema tapete]MBD2774756.1 DUF1802 family protein [Iningainema tapete BLCC-T55]